jgi:ribosomal protein S15P/S13E
MPKKKSKKEAKSGSLSVKEAEEQIVSLANAGHTPSEIGLILRDEHGIKDFQEMAGKSIQEVLGEHKLLGEMPEDLLNLIKRSVVLYKHMEKNKKDYSAKRGYELTVSKIRRLTKYYDKKAKIPAGWRYTPEEAALLVK